MFKKNYIGKGKEVFTDVIKVVIPAEALKNCVFEMEGKKYVSFEIGKMKEADKFGKTHTVYYTTKEEEAPAPAPEKDDLPF